jgi:hypothetical protein
LSVVPNIRELEVPMVVLLKVIVHTDETFKMSVLQEMWVGWDNGGLFIFRNVLAQSGLAPLKNHLSSWKIY